MPKYEYACKSCGERLEVKQSFTDDALTDCPVCGGPLRKVFSSPGIVLRGPGFYRTDHRSPYRPDGVRPAEKDKDREPSESRLFPDSKSGESQSGDSKSGDSKSGDSKSGDSKSGDSKSAETKSSDRDSGSKGSDSKGSRDRESRGGSESSRSGESSGDTGGSKDAARTA
jgi:putative FmdB family regulatory protein